MLQEYILFYKHVIDEFIRVIEKLVYKQAET